MKYKSNHPDTLLFNTEFNVKSKITIKNNKFEAQQRSCEQCLMCGQFALSNYQHKAVGESLKVYCKCSSYECDCKYCKELTVIDIISYVGDWYNSPLTIVDNLYRYWAILIENKITGKHRCQALRKSNNKIKSCFQEIC